MVKTLKAFKCIYVLIQVFVVKIAHCNSSGKSYTNTKTTIKDFSGVEKVTAGDLKQELPNPLGNDLRLIGLFLAEHKYFDVDRRYTFSSAKFEKPTFYKHFPIPRLRKRYLSVVSACDRGFIPCVNEIFKKAKQSGSLAKIHKNFGNRSMQIASYHPFKDHQELFRYRVTASYYMCWYTEMGEKPLALPHKHDCFRDLENTEQANGNIIQDFRIRTGYGKYSVFTCSYLWFCPDPCYGKSTGGILKSEQQALDDPKNPCRNLKKKHCFWDVGKNKNFEDLIRNKFNYSCDCENERKGFIWSPIYSLCVDRDECYEEKDSCEADKICLNTVGGYTCTCRRGFYLDKQTSSCVRQDLLSAAAATALERKRKDKAVEKKKPGGVLYILKLLVDIVRGHCSTLSLPKFLYAVCLLLYLLLDHKM